MFTAMLHGDGGMEGLGKLVVNPRSRLIPPGSCVVYELMAVMIIITNVIPVGINRYSSRRRLRIAVGIQV